MGNGTKRAKCAGIKDDGTRCEAWPIKGKKLCHWHSGGATKAGSKGGKVTGAKASKLKLERDIQRHRIAAGGLQINDWQDLKEFCEEKLYDCPPQFSSWYLNTLTKCLEHLADQNTVHYVVYVDPLLPSEPVPPLPDLPGFEFTEIKDPNGPE